LDKIDYPNSMHEQKNILITGCSSGIGLTVAMGLRDRGYRVFASARKSRDVARLAASNLEAVQLDLASSSSIADAVSEVLQASNGRLFALFNNGAYGQPGAVEDLSRSALQHQFETNLFGWHELTCHLIPIMRKQGQGRIIQNSSILGFMALPYRGAYVASKYALEGLTDTLRLELQGTGIHVSLIEPGPIESRFRDNAYAMWKKHIDPSNSYHRTNYQAMQARLQKPGATAPFTLPASAILKKVIHALEHPRPKARYPVTFPTYLFSTLRRLLSTRAMDKILIKISASGSR
jgi:NAD(P)-dependent dehydrogenase (short-subunit alcohol dehydrogenase family)